MSYQFVKYRIPLTIWAEFLRGQFYRFHLESNLTSESIFVNQQIGKDMPINEFIDNLETCLVGFLFHFTTLRNFPKNEETGEILCEKWNYCQAFTRKKPK